MPKYTKNEDANVSADDVLKVTCRLRLVAYDLAENATVLQEYAWLNKKSETREQRILNNVTDLANTIGYDLVKKDDANEG